MPRRGGGVMAGRPDTPAGLPGSLEPSPPGERGISINPCSLGPLSRLSPTPTPETFLEPVGNPLCLSGILVLS